MVCSQALADNVRRLRRLCKRRGSPGASRRQHGQGPDVAGRRNAGQAAVSRACRHSGNEESAGLMSRRPVWAGARILPASISWLAITGHRPVPRWSRETTGKLKPLETYMPILRKTSAIAIMITMRGTIAHAQTKPAAKDVVIVHGALADGSGWRAIYNILNKDGFHVTIVQEPLTGLVEDVDATKRVIDQQTGPVVLVGHSYGGSVITEAGADPKVSALVYVAALQPDAGEASGQLMSKFAAPNDAMRKATNRATPEKYFFIPAARFHETYAADLSAADAQFLADSQQQLAEKALGASVSVAAWRSKPNYAILTTQDHVISPELQRWMYQR